MFFETSARSGANIKVLFNELAKKLTGIDTNPINNVEVKNNNGFSLRGGATGQGTGDATGKTDEKKIKKSKCC